MANPIAPLPTNVPVRVISDQAGHHQRALGNWQSDNADDFAAPPGTPVLAVETGVVRKVNTKHEGSHSGNIFGAQLTINGESGTGWFYTHIVRVPLKEGDVVHQGQVIGYVTRWADNPYDSHVHVAASTSGLADTLAHAPQVDPGAAAAATVSMPATPYSPTPVPSQLSEPSPAAGQPNDTGASSGSPLAPEPVTPFAALPSQPPGMEAPPDVGLPGSVDLASPHRQVADSWQLISSQPFSGPDAQRWAQNALLGSGQ